MSILFPHLCEDVEFLLPPDEDVQMMRDRSTAVTVPAGAGASSYATTPSRSSRRVHENAVAGPSRLG
jgi:E3 ubiquitin-protein ligase SHPRH